jgi:hypothetical protein
MQAIALVHMAGACTRHRICPSAVLFQTPGPRRRGALGRLASGAAQGAISGRRAPQALGTNR